LFKFEKEEYSGVSSAEMEINVVGNIKKLYFSWIFTGAR